MKYQQLHVDQNDQKIKIPVSCPEIIKDYNSGMDSVDLLDKKTAAYKLDRSDMVGVIN